MDKSSSALQVKVTRPAQKKPNLYDPPKRHTSPVFKKLRPIASFTGHSGVGARTVSPAEGSVNSAAAMLTGPMPYQ